VRKYVSRKWEVYNCAACVHWATMRRAKRAPGGLRVSGFRV